MKAIISKEGLTVEELPFFVRNDVGYNIVFTIKQDNDSIVSLSGATVRFKLKNISTDVVKVNRECTLDNPTSGICSYKPATGDLDTQGVYDAELEVITSGGTIINTIKLGRVTILEDI